MGGSPSSRGSCPDAQVAHIPDKQMETTSGPGQMRCEAPERISYRTGPCGRSMPGKTPDGYPDRRYGNWQNRWRTTETFRKTIVFPPSHMNRSETFVHDPFKF